MAQSVIQICNIALGRVGISRAIDDLNEASEEARACRLHYEPCRDRLLRELPWPFALRFVALPLVATDPNASWGFAYRFPSDVISLESLERPAGSIGRAGRMPFELGGDSAGRLIYTDQQDAVARVIRRVEDPTQFDPAFASTLSWLLASEIAMPLSVSTSLREQAVRMYMAELSAARAHARNESEPDRRFDESSFVTARG
jgi:hypothetical protein